MGTSFEHLPTTVVRFTHSNKHSQCEDVDGGFDSAFEGVGKVRASNVELTIVPELVQHAPAP